MENEVEMEPRGLLGVVMQGSVDKYQDHLETPPSRGYTRVSEGNGRGNENYNIISGLGFRIRLHC